MKQFDLTEEELSVVGNLLAADSARANSMREYVLTTEFMDAVSSRNSKLAEKVSSKKGSFSDDELGFLKQLLIDENLRMNNWRDRNTAKMMDKLQDKNNKIMRKLTQAVEV